MEIITVPQPPQRTEIDKHTTAFSIPECYPGYGTTLGNALRRVLLSSLEGSAITSIKIKGVTHEFSAVDGVAEDVVQIILNLKKVRFVMHEDGPITVSLAVKGGNDATAGDFKTSSAIEVVNTDHHIATVTDKKSTFELECTVEKGLGYVPVDQQDRDEKEIGVIAIDAIYTPVRRVNFTVENMRVDKRTDYEKVTLEIETDGSLSPEDAFERATTILVEQFSAMNTVIDANEAKKELAKEKELKKQKEHTEEAPLAVQPELPESISGVSTRTMNILETNNLTAPEKISALTEDELNELDGMGGKGIKEIKKAIGDLGLTLNHK